MDDKSIERINLLFNKSKNEGLTEAEKVEQADLRSSYIQAIRNNLRGSLNQISLLNPDGTITDLAKKDQQ